MKINFKQANKANFADGRSVPVEYIVIHYTSNKGDTAKNNADYFAREDTGTSAHYFVDENEIWQSVKDTDTAWHCGGGRQSNKGGTFYQKCKNSNSIGVEICMNGKKGNVRRGSIDTAVELVRYLMERYRVPINRVIRHYDVNGKDCPAPMVADESLWNEFKANSEDDSMLTYEQWKAYMEKYAQERAEAPADAWAGESISRMKERGVTDGERPQAYVTRQEAVTMIDRAIKG